MSELQAKVCKGAVHMQSHLFRRCAAPEARSHALYYRIRRTGSKVLDLGCSPGAWLQVACQQLGPPDRGGTVLGVDIQVSQVLGANC